MLDQLSASYAVLYLSGAHRTRRQPQHAQQCYQPNGLPDLLEKEIPRFYASLLEAVIFAVSGVHRSAAHAAQQASGDLVHRGAGAKDRKPGQAE